MSEEPLNIEPEQKKARPWEAWATLGLGFIIFLTYSIFQLIVHGIVSVLTFQSSPLDNIEEFIKSLATNGLAISLSIIVAVPIGIVLIIACIKLRKGITLTEYLGLIPLSIKTLMLLLLIPLGLMITLAILSNYIVKIDSPNFMADAYANSVWPALFWIAVVIFAPAFEEALFRGFAIAGLRQSPIGTKGAIVLTSLFWALLHLQYSWFGMTTILIIGVVLGSVRIKTGSLWGPLMIHSIWNLLQMLALTALPQQ